MLTGALRLTSAGGASHADSVDLDRHVIAECTIVVGLREDLDPADDALLPDEAEGYDGYSLAIVAGRSVKASGTGKLSPRNENITAGRP